MKIDGAKKECKKKVSNSKELKKKKKKTDHKEVEIVTRKRNLNKREKRNAKRENLSYNCEERG